MTDFNSDKFFSECDNITDELNSNAINETDYQAIGKAQAELFANELRDVYTRYQYSTVGDMERSGMLTAGEDILSALSKIELFKQSLC